MIAAWMLYAVLVSLPIAAVTVGVAALLRRRGLPERGVWLGGLTVTVGAPLVLALWSVARSRVDPVSTAEAPVAFFRLPEFIHVPETSILQSLGGPLTVLWVVLSLVLALRIARGALHLARLSREWTEQHVAGEAVLVTEDLGPAVLGLTRPRVVLPAWMLGMSADQLELIMLHEREHIRSRDPWALAIGVGLRVLLPWHPAVWFLTSGLRQALEIDCDRRVTRRRTDVARYGETVLAVAANVRPSGPTPLPAFTESNSFLKRRLIAMTQPTRSLGRLGVGALVLLGILALAGACEVPLPSEFMRDAQEVEIPAPETETVNPMTEENLDGMAERSEIPEQPGFTPFTVAPSITNRSEVVTAMNEFYPADLRDMGIGGTIRVYLFVTEEGVVSDVRIDESSGNAKLDDGALEVAKRFEFTPALNGDEPVAVWIAFPITFQVR